MAPPHLPITILVMGVAGCGKSTIGDLLAKRLMCPFIEGDDYHPAENSNKMRAGIPLTDADRMPWLELIRAELLANQERKLSCVVACSALKKRYRDFLGFGIARFVIIFLAVSPADAAARLSARKGHFFSEKLLTSQFEALEPPEDSIQVDVAKTPEEITCTIIERLLGNH